MIRNLYSHSLAVFRQAGKPSKAMLAYEKALDWQEVFEIAVQELSPEDLSDAGYRIAGKLVSML